MSTFMREIKATLSKQALSGLFSVNDLLLITAYLCRVNRVISVAQQSFTC